MQPLPPTWYLQPEPETPVLLTRGNNPADRNAGQDRHPEQGVPGSARLPHTGDSTVDVTNMASAVQESGRDQREKIGVGNEKDSDAHLINLDAKSDIFQPKQKLWTLSPTLLLQESNGRWRSPALRDWIRCRAKEQLL